MNIQRFIPLAIITIALLAIGSCKRVKAAKGSTEDHSVNETGFTAIDFQNGGKLTFTESNTTSIIINTTQKVFNAMEVKVENSVLIIKKRKGYIIKNSNEIEITITAPNVSSFTSSGSGSMNVTLNNVEAISTFRLIVSGSGSISSNSVNATNQTMTASGSGSITVSQSIAEACVSKISGSGGISINGGTATNSTISVSGSGSYRAFNLESNNVEAEVSGSGSADLTALDNLYARISGSGNITYKGTPLIDFSGSGSGELINGN